MSITTSFSRILHGIKLLHNIPVLYMHTLLLQSLLAKFDSSKEDGRFSWTELTRASRTLEHAIDIIHHGAICETIEYGVVQLGLSFFSNRLIGCCSKRCSIGSSSHTHDGIFGKEATVCDLSFINGVDSDNVSRLEIVVKCLFSLKLPDLCFGQRWLKRIRKN